MSIIKTFSTIGAPSVVAPTIQKFTSGSGTYTTPTSPRTPLYIRVRMVGGGGGGAGSATVAASNAGDGTAGGNTTFGTALLVANGGGQGKATTTSAAGGTASLGTGPIGTAIAGAIGGPNVLNQGTSIFCIGGYGASSPFGGAGSPGKPDGTSPGNAAIANSGSGGGGGSGQGNQDRGGGGGSAGGYVDAIITSPAATYAYAVGAAGSGGAAGTSGVAGGAGGSGYIEVTEYYA